MKKNIFKAYDRLMRYLHTLNVHYVRVHNVRYALQQSCRWTISTGDLTYINIEINDVRINLRWVGINPEINWYIIVEIKSYIFLMCINHDINRGLLISSWFTINVSNTVR